MVSALAASGLFHEYPGAHRALDGVDLELERGELVCILGPNGSGKSTALKILGGVLEPTRGRVEVEGRALRDLRPTERAKRIATVPQSLLALPDLRVESFVLGGRYPYLGPFGKHRRGDRAAIRSALAEVDALEWIDRGLNELSGGEHQRVLIARALAQEAGILLFDEPTASLDPEHQVLVFDLIRRLVKGGRASLVATHELSLASRYADRILIFDGGKIRAQGTPDEILRPEVLEPAFGAHLVFASSGDASGRPLVVPWPQGEEPQES
jgi:iron complex transport system ATP-binding protein